MKRERKDTRVEIPKLLHPYRHIEGVQTVIDEATAGEFHDYKNNKYVEGKTALVGLLTELWKRTSLSAFLEIRKQVIDGDFDEEADEDDIQMMREELPETLWPTFGLAKKH